MIVAVVFDIGNVVCAFDPARRLRVLANETGLARERIHEAIWASGLDGRAETGELLPAEVERMVLDALDGRIDAASLRAAWSTAFTLEPDVCAIVNGLGVPTFAFTNNGPMFTDCRAHELARVSRLFERVVCSWEIRARKPDPRAFERLCVELHRRPEALLFVDDSPENTASARSVGLAAVTFTSATRLAADLDRHAGLRARRPGSAATQVP
jgi:glucose-1-phosphatase